MSVGKEGAVSAQGGEPRACFRGERCVCSTRVTLLLLHRLRVACQECVFGSPRTSEAAVSIERNAGRRGSL